MKKIVFEKKRNKEIDPKPLIYKDHGPAVTRRDFLKTGLIPLAATVVSSSILQLLSKTVLAGEVESLIPFLVFDLAGGAALPANFLVGGQGGSEDLLSDYSSLGWDPRASGSVDKRFGVPMNTKSGIYQGLIATLSEDAQKKFRLATICNVSEADTSRNQLSLLNVMSYLGEAGTSIPNSIGNSRTPSGGNSQYAFNVNMTPPVLVNSLESFKNSILTHQDDLITRMQRFTQLSNQDRVGVYSKLSGNTLSNFDPEQIVAGININGGGSELVTSVIAYNVIKGTTGAGCITIGGCDYHDNTRTSGDAKDLDIGRSIGIAVEIAHRLQKPLFIQILTDGGIYAKEANGPWLGDSQQQSLSVMGFYDPRGPAELTSTQLGNYTPAAIVDTTTAVAQGGDTTRSAYAILANYLSLNNRSNDLNKVSRSLFSKEDVEKSLIIKRRA